MDIIDNIVYASFASALQPLTTQSYTAADPRIRSKFISPFPPNPATFVPDNVGTATEPVFTYQVDEKMIYSANEDPEIIEDAILRHWYDVNARVSYDSSGVKTLGVTLAAGDSRYSKFEKSSTYHLIFAYLVENTRILQIFERMIERYLHDEDFGIADHTLAFNWIQNSERLFFKNDSLRSSNVRSLIRPSADATRRNAYWRMFGMDLAFGDINSTSGQLPYTKARTSNQQFIPVFEKYLSEIWQSFINANNSSGVNTADINIVIDLATQLRELLVARRGNVGSSSYANLNLSREEFSSVLMTSWFTFIVSDDTPVVQFLKCQSSTIGERLIKIGNKVGIPAHNKCQTLFEMAGAAANILRVIEEGGVFDDPARMPDIFRSLIPPGGTDEDKNFMSDFLTVINNWEKATGHKIKNTEANIIAKVKVQQNGTKVQPVLN